MATMLVPFLVTLIWVIAGDRRAASGTHLYPWNIEPIYAGLAASLLTYAAARTIQPRRPPTAGAPSLEEIET
jgi:hypothetical protein